MMNIGILGTGMVGNALGTKLVQGGHLVTMVARARRTAKAAQKWAAPLGDRARTATFGDAAAFGEIVINCTGRRAIQWRRWAQSTPDPCAAKS